MGMRLSRSTLVVPFQILPQIIVLLQPEAGKLLGPDEVKADERYQAVIEARQPVAETQQGIDENVDHEGEQQVDFHQREKRREHDGHGQQDDGLDRADARELAVRLDFTIAFFGHGEVCFTTFPHKRSPCPLWAAGGTMKFRVPSMPHKGAGLRRTREVIS